MSYGIVYKATNTVNGKAYIGATTRSMCTRFREHMVDSKSGANAFRAAITKYGAGVFLWEVLAVCNSRVDLDATESRFIARDKTMTKYGGGYNINSGGSGNSGRKLTPEQCRRISEGHKGLVKTKECREKLSAALMGRKLSPEHVAKLRQRTMSNEQRKHLSALKTGTVNTDHTRKLTSEKEEVLHRIIWGENFASIARDYRCPTSTFAALVHSWTDNLWLNKTRPRISTSQLEEMSDRRSRGESFSSIAKDYPFTGGGVYSALKRRDAKCP